MYFFIILIYLFVYIESQSNIRHLWKYFLLIFFSSRMKTMSMEWKRLKQDFPVECTSGVWRVLQLSFFMHCWECHCLLVNKQMPSEFTALICSFTHERICVSIYVICHLLCSLLWDWFCRDAGGSLGETGTNICHRLDSLHHKPTILVMGMKFA